LEEKAFRQTCRRKARVAYVNDNLFWIAVNRSFKPVPRNANAVAIAVAINAAIRPYSIAVIPS
jgi:hypothetical protein